MKNPKGGSSQKTPQPSKVLPSKEPLPEVTAPRYSDKWMEEIDTRNQVAAMNELLRRQALRSAQENASKAAKTKQPRGDSSEGSSPGAQIPTRELTTADVQRIAAEGEIPEEQLLELGSWLRHAVDCYDQLARIYESCLTKRQKRDSIKEIRVLARKLGGLLKQPWVHGCMVSHEVRSLLSRKGYLSSGESAAIVEQVERDRSGVEALANRSAAILKELKSRPENKDEQNAAIGAQNLEIKHLHNLMRFYWMRLGREPKFNEQSPYVKFVRAVYGIVGLDDEASFETIRSRHTAALR